MVNGITVTEVGQHTRPPVTEREGERIERGREREGGRGREEGTVKGGGKKKEIDIDKERKIDKQTERGKRETIISAYCKVIIFYSG